MNYQTIISALEHPMGIIIIGIVLVVLFYWLLSTLQKRGLILQPKPVAAIPAPSPIALPVQTSGMTAPQELVAVIGAAIAAFESSKRPAFSRALTQTGRTAWTMAARQENTMR